MTKVLIISTNAIGDTYVSMSALPILRENFGEIEIDFVIAPHSEFLFECEELRNLFVVRRNISEMFTTLKLVRREKYDYVFSFFPGLVNTFFLKGAKAVVKSGFYNFIWRRRWERKNQKGFVKRKKYFEKFLWRKEDNYLTLVSLALNKAGIPAQKIEKLKFAPNANLISKYSEAVVVHPFSLREDKCLSCEQLNAIASYLKETGEREIFILGSKKLLAAKNSLPGFVKLKLNPSPKELAEIVNCKLFLGVDSFPLHLADAYNANFLGMFCATNPASVLLHPRKTISFNASRLSDVGKEELLNTIKSKLAEIKTHNIKKRVI